MRRRGGGGGGRSGTPFRFRSPGRGRHCRRLCLCCLQRRPSGFFRCVHNRAAHFSAPLPLYPKLRAGRPPPTPGTAAGTPPSPFPRGSPPTPQQHLSECGTLHKKGSCGRPLPPLLPPTPLRVPAALTPSGTSAPRVTPSAEDARELPSACGLGRETRVENLFFRTPTRGNSDASGFGCPCAARRPGA